MALCPACGKNFDPDKATIEQQNIHGTLCCSYACSISRTYDDKIDDILEERDKYRQALEAIAGSQIGRKNVGHFSVGCLECGKKIATALAALDKPEGANA